MSAPVAKGSTEPGAAFQPLDLAHIRLPNRLMRAATYEGMATHDGTPKDGLGDLYGRLAEGGIGSVITGFAFITPEGRAMQPGQCGIESDKRIGQWKAVLSQARRAGADTKIFLQLAHTGRQTRRAMTGHAVMGVSSRRCTYFRQRVRPMDDAGIRAAIEAFGRAARRAQEAGFDGVQLHGAHGYLIHQFLSPWTNRRRDVWGDRPRFLEEVLAAVRRHCSDRFPVLVKLSAADDNKPGLRLADTIETARRLAPLGVDAVEISYGTMEYALNIIRGACPATVALRVNPLFRDMPAALRWLWVRFFMTSYVARFLPFEEHYNLHAAVAVRRAAGIPVMVVGGVRSGAGVARCLADGVDAVSLCRPLICEPDFPRRLFSDTTATSPCTNCNLCTIYCDDDQPLRCYRRKEANYE